MMLLAAIDSTINLTTSRDKSTCLKRIPPPISSTSDSAAPALRHEVLFRLPGMHQEDVTVAVARILQRLAGTYGHHMDRDARPFVEAWQQRLIETRVSGGRR